MKKTILSADAVDTVAFRLLQSGRFPGRSAFFAIVADEWMPAPSIDEINEYLKDIGRYLVFCPLTEKSINEMFKGISPADVLLRVASSPHFDPLNGWYYIDDDKKPVTVSESEIRKEYKTVVNVHKLESKNFAGCPAVVSAIIESEDEIIQRARDFDCIYERDE